MCVHSRINRGIEASKTDKKGRNWIIFIRSITVLQQRARGSSRHDLKHDFAMMGMVLFLYRDYNTAKKSPQRNAFLSGNWAKTFRNKQGSCFRVNSIEISHMWKLWTSKYPSNINIETIIDPDRENLFDLVDWLINCTSIKCKCSRLNIGFQQRRVKLKLFRVNKSE